MNNERPGLSGAEGMVGGASRRKRYLHQVRGLVCYLLHVEIRMRCSFQETHA